MDWLNFMKAVVLEHKAPDQVIDAMDEHELLSLEASIVNCTKGLGEDHPNRTVLPKIEKKLKKIRSQQ